MAYITMWFVKEWIFVKKNPDYLMGNTEKIKKNEKNEHQNIDKY